LLEFYGKASDLVGYKFKKHDMIVTLTYREDTEPVVMVALGSEMQAFELGESLDYWPSMIEYARKTPSECLEALLALPRGSARENLKWLRHLNKNERSIASETE
jgi:hypothetical protein